MEKFPIEFSVEISSAQFYIIIIMSASNFRGKYIGVHAHNNKFASQSVVHTPKKIVDKRMNQDK